MTLSQDPPSILKPSTFITPNIPPKTEAAPPKPDPLKYSPIRLPATECLIKPQVSLAPFTSFRVGGPAEWFVSPRRAEEMQASIDWANQEGLPVTLLGAGSNLLVSDRGLPGLVICTRHFRHAHFDAETGQITAGAGEPLVRLAWQAAERGWEGLEWAVGIPGTLGGAVVMNAGAHGDCTADVLVNAHVLLPNGTTEILLPGDLGFNYRTSALQGDRRLVTQATLQLKPGADPAQVMAATTTHLKQRQTSQPYHLPSCGSVFRNPGPQTAGWLIEQAGLKGHRIGGAQVAQRHANFILNCGGATAYDIFQLIRYVQQQVEQHWSLRLEPEVKMLGEFQLA
ncbi:MULTISPECIES: UDP-N-acetylmuramate dehydrogenase [Trichocoleus]|uniref:UDP-N-acetylenolpyruvoylglucosamine reductase n=1 Tax=Trichocoleus desertorum GB2-A4 TaxID=2933944 RepID=A0ABV0J4I8_9CYAN|nr:MULTISPECIES: UDP-N-acetylmuramate dehydrogenase [unclassified Trichocoleus]MBD1860685.1 UDP-N-acetylmuramate dehydrogenase [Trichocoleus sp. FACHB-46]MBD2094360.1 UDP-N-acetylmuramate dehydrogenase [Trichocoleus sp. FACHB-591]MBD2119581.1 UDP-N-acetylmuramate dehydrogenase [Trichocoleus sp. FACHB-262]